MAIKYWEQHLARVSELKKASLIEVSEAERVDIIYDVCMQYFDDKKVLIGNLEDEEIKRVVGKHINIVVKEYMNICCNSPKDSCKEVIWWDCIGDAVAERIMKAKIK